MPERRIDPRTGHIYEYQGDEGWQRVSGPEEELGAFGAFQVGAHLGARRLFRGLQSIGASAGNLGPEIQETIRRRQAAEDALLAPVSERYPVAATLGEVTPELATGLIGGTGAAAGRRLLTRSIGRPGSTMAEQAVIGAGIGAIGYDETLSGRVFNAALGAMGGAAGFQVGRMADRVRRQISAYARGGARAEVDLTTTGQMTGRAAGAGRIEAGPDETIAARAERAREQAGEAQAAVERQGVELPSETRDIRVREAENLGFELTPGMRAGKGPFEKLEAAAESMPYTSGALDGLKARNYQRLQNLIARSIGIPDASDLGAENLARAEQQISARFADVLQEVDRAGGIPAREVKNAADDALEELSGLGRDLPGRRVVDEIKAVLEAAPDDAALTGLEARRWRTYLNRRYRAFSANEGDEASADLVEQVMNGLDDAIERRVPREMRGTYRAARQQWRMLIALRRGVGVRDDGMLNLRTFSNNAKRIFRAEMRGRMGNLAPELRDALVATRAMSALTSAFPDSGTATRLAGQMALNAPVRTAAATFGASLGGDLYAKTLGGGSLARTAAKLGPVWPAAPTAAGAVGRALASRGELEP